MWLVLGLRYGAVGWAWAEAVHYLPGLSRFLFFLLHSEQCEESSKRKVTWSTDPAQTVPITIGEAGISSAEPITVGQMFRQAKEQFPNHPALCFKEEDTWNKLSYMDYYNLCIRAAKSFLKVIIMF